MSKKVKVSTGKTSKNVDTVLFNQELPWLPHEKKVMKNVLFSVVNCFQNASFISVSQYL